MGRELFCLITMLVVKKLTFRNTINDIISFSSFYFFQETLNQRLDARVDSMVKDGLLAEIRSFHNEFVTET